MKTLVIYKSKTGFTKKYAEWIAEELKADVFDTSKVNVGTLKNYDTVIYGGGLHAGGINGIKFIIQSMDILKNRKVIVFATGASVSNEEIVSAVFKKNFTDEQQKYIKFFYLRGGFNYSKLNPLDKIAMSLFKWLLSRKKNLTSGEKMMLDMYCNPVDYAIKDNIKEIIKYVNHNLVE